MRLLGVQSGTTSADFIEDLNLNSCVQAMGTKIKYVVQGTEIKY